MTPDALRSERLRSHRLTAPAATPREAAEHMLAVQSQEFWGGRWALGSRTVGSTLREVDALFDDGALVRAWTQRGTLHIVPARDLGWMLQVTAERQMRAQRPRLRELGLDHDVLARIEKAVRRALRGGGALTRAELFGVFEDAGVDPAGQRGAHAIGALAFRGVLCQGPVVARDGAISREQRFVLVEEHIRGAVWPADPVVEMFVRYVDGHGPATAEDFAWWSGLTLTAARAAAAEASDRVDEIEDGVFVALSRPDVDPHAASVLALASFEEYYISYADRTPVGSESARDAIGPGRNGMVRPILLADGEIVGTWRASTAVGRHADAPETELFADVDVAAATARYTAFVSS